MTEPMTKPDALRTLGRALQSLAGYDCWTATLNEAADELEALTKERDQLKGHVEILLRESKHAGLNETSHQRAAKHAIGLT